MTLEYKKRERFDKEIGAPDNRDSELNELCPDAVGQRSHPTTWTSRNRSRWNLYHATPPRPTSFLPPNDSERWNKELERRSGVVNHGLTQEEVGQLVGKPLERHTVIAGNMNEVWRYPSCLAVGAIAKDRVSSDSAFLSRFPCSKRVGIDLAAPAAAHESSPTPATLIRSALRAVS
jgi:hypothetical protein